MQNTQSLIDQTQLRLATGLSVNSALDNPQNFFAAESLDNRASDLGRLLDGISQSVRAIEVANNGVEALTDLVEQADAIVESARDELSAANNTARAVGNLDLGNVDDLTSFASIDDGDFFDIITTNADGLEIRETIEINAGDSAFAFTERITNQFADNQNGEIVATITEQGFISIESADGRTFRIADSITNALTDAGFDALGLGDFFDVEFTSSAGAFNTRASATIVAGNTINSISLFESAGNLAEAGDVVANATFLDSDGNSVISDITPGATFFTGIETDAGPQFITFSITATTTFQDIIDTFNQTEALEPFIRLGFDNTTGQLSFTSINSELENLEFGLFQFGGSTFNLGLGDPANTIDLADNATNAFSLESRVFSFNQSSTVLDNLASDFNDIRAQIDTIVEDASFRGVNLLDNDDLSTFFNEDNSSSLVTEGVDFTAGGLGLIEAGFGNEAEIEETETRVRNALDTIRNFGVTLSNNLSIIETRQDFTESTIITLSAGADDLTIADQNEEGANLLALQTRQSLGITALSLASQSQQAVLSLF